MQKYIEKTLFMPSMPINVRPDWSWSIRILWWKRAECQSAWHARRPKKVKQDMSTHLPHGLCDMPIDSVDRHNDYSADTPRCLILIVGRYTFWFCCQVWSANSVNIQVKEVRRIIIKQDKFKVTKIVLIIYVVLFWSASAQNFWKKLS